MLAHQMAFESSNVRSEMIEAMEFPELSQEHAIGGVPDTIINHGAGRVVGAVPEDVLLEEIQKIIQ